MDGIQLLLNDHRKIEGIFAQFGQGGDSQTFNQLFNQLFQELSIHAVIEEQFFYPELAKFPETKDMVAEVYEEHADAKAALAELAALDNTTAEWSQKITQLRDDIAHHVQEEENDIFAAVRQRLTPDQLELLGEKLQRGKQEAMGSFLITGPLQEIQQAQMLHLQGMTVEQAGMAAMASGTSGQAAMGGMSSGTMPDPTMSDSMRSPSTFGTMDTTDIHMSGGQDQSGMGSMTSSAMRDDDTRSLQQGM